MAIVIVAIGKTLKITGNDQPQYVHMSHVRMNIHSNDFVTIVDVHSKQNLVNVVHTDITTPVGATAVLKADAIAALITA